jgi:hypothetical protein
MINTDDLMQRFCDAGAQAVRRYVDVSGDRHLNMPEYFMPSFVFDSLGGKTTATLETSFSYLVDWNAGARQRRGLPQQFRDARLLLLAQQLGGRRVDMVLFEGEEDHKPKDEQDFFALVEFKRGWIDAASFPGRISDRDKLLMLLDHIDTCPWGIACGWIPQNHYDWQQTQIRGSKDRWFESKIQLPDYDAPLFFCARLFARGSDEDRIRDLLATVPEIT